jgi:hypothetical protein
MSKAYAQGGRFFFETADGSITKEAVLVIDPTHGNNLIEMRILDSDGNPTGEIIRAKINDSGTICADFPGLGEGFATDENGKITNC